MNQKSWQCLNNHLKWYHPFFLVVEFESVNTPVKAYFWLTSCPAMVWGCRQAFLQMTSALTKEMTLTGEWQTDRQLLRQGCCRQQHSVWAQSSTWSTACFAYHYNWSVHDNTIITCSDRWWTEKLSRNTAPTLFTYVPYCFLCSILLLLFDVMCSAHLYSSVSAYSLAQLLSLRTPAAARMLGAGCGGKEH